MHEHKSFTKMQNELINFIVLLPALSDIT